eukprot:scaffold297_cov386-Prasinococcus_capsulatus_cf.AAC.6
MPSHRPRQRREVHQKRHAPPLARRRLLSPARPSRPLFAGPKAGRRSPAEHAGPPVRSADHGRTTRVVPSTSSPTPLRLRALISGGSAHSAARSRNPMRIRLAGGAQRPVQEPA